MSAKQSLLEELLSSSQLPSVPAVAIQLLQVCRDPDSDPSDIVRVIRNDPALAAKILRSVNSSYFSFRSEVTSLERAVTLIGRTVISSLGLSFSLSSEAMTEGPLTLHYRRYWLQSIVQASAAETLGKLVSPESTSELFMTGLLLDLGRLALLKVAGSEYLPVLEQLESCEQTLAELESTHFGFSHVDAGACLMERWKLPDIMVTATRFHDSQPADLDPSSDSIELTRAMMLASRVGDYFCGQNTCHALARLRSVAESLYGFDAQTLDNYLEQTDKAIQQTAELLNADTSDLPCPAELMTQACQQLAEITIQQEIEHQELREQVLHDPLTGLYNRRYCDEALSTLIGQTTRTAITVGVLFLDVDHFKQANDTYGHQFGDLVLKRVGELLRATVRDSDTAARFGGEEFVILTTDTSRRGLGMMAERIRRTIADEDFRHEGERVSVTVSIGGTVTVPGRKESGLEQRLIDSADAAMYESKRNGRNRVTVDSLASELEETLATLIERHRFTRWLVERHVLSESMLPEIAANPCGCDSSIGQLAVQKGWLTHADVMAVLEDQSLSAERFGVIACRLDLLTVNQVAELLANQREDATLVAMRLIKREILDATEVNLLLDQFRDSLNSEFEVTAAQTKSAESTADVR